MVTVGELLYHARIKKNLTLEQIEKATHIRAKFLDALEKNDFSRLPPGTFTKGFIKNYASFLGLSPQQTLAFYRRQTSEETPVVLPKINPLLARFTLTPQRLTTIGVLLLLATFFSYLIYSYLRFAGSPELAVASPENNITVDTDSIPVTGKTDPNSTLTINDQPIRLLENGSFAVSVPLEPGLNTLTITATNKYQKQTTITRRLRLERIDN